MAAKKRRKDYVKIPITAEEERRLFGGNQLDFTVLKKGMFIPVEIFMDFFQMGDRNPRFRIELLKFRSLVYDNTPFCTTTVKGGLLILTDSDGLHGEHKAAMNRVKGALRNANNLCNRVDPEFLSLEERVRQNRIQNKVQRLQFAIQQARTGIHIGKILRLPQPVEK